MRDTVTHGDHTSPIHSDRALPAPSAGQRQLAEAECVKRAILYVTEHGCKCHDPGLRQSPADSVGQWQFAGAAVRTDICRDRASLALRIADAPARHHQHLVDDGPSRDLLALTGAGHWGGLLFGLVWLAAALFFSARSGRSFWKWVGGIGTGLMIAVGWGYAHLVSANSFQVVQVRGLTFSGPSAKWLMRVLSSPAPAIGFDFGLLPGVFLGSFIGAWIGKDLKLEGFANG